MEKTAKFKIAAEYYIRGQIGSLEQNQHVLYQGVTSESANNYTLRLRERADQLLEHAIQLAEQYTDCKTFAYDLNLTVGGDRTPRKIRQYLRDNKIKLLPLVKLQLVQN